LKEERNIYFGTGIFGGIELMKRRRKRRSGRKHIKVAVHTSTYLSGLSIPEMERLVRGSLLDAFLPKILHISATPEQADVHYEEYIRDPYWQSKYSARAIAEIHKQYGGILPMVCQYQLDSSTLISCLKVERTISFEPIYHFESNRYSEGDMVSISDFDASEMFFALSTEEHTPAIKKWDDMRWDEIGVVPKENFQHFIRILLRRLEVIVLDMWKSGDGYAAASGLDQEIVKGTYLYILKDRFNMKHHVAMPQGEKP
jgi:hypothetical protein